ncbi:DUF3253 domain-containing protein [Actinacidiphila alni]|uniref:DUF3253 domain-containing protein n=1 Tax=Actinacidiphila alni TaxID=380248 RepID=UPI003456D53C
MTRDERTTDRSLERVIVDLLDRRGPDSSICPSDAAREAYAGQDDGWRELMERTRQAAWRLADAGEVEVARAGRPITRAQAHGPIRIRRARRRANGS